ncbi:hypothetical protein V501_00486 [Pseudogymnoascus sp. VKM F-4519 (FW-2642)]|nr:hypothetical protein V501_00486 [Pseudogymnoascus sp. VKM F-4519 (FW-2642)]
MLVPNILFMFLAAAATYAAADPLPLKERAIGFVTRPGTGFVVDGKSFDFVGTNAYWASGLSSGDLESLVSQMNPAGMKVLQIFAWSDNVVTAAEAAGMKLAVPMIGNWGPSISLYIQQIVGSGGTHDTFYSNSRIVNASKNYVSFSPCHRTSKGLTRSVWFTSAQGYGNSYPYNDSDAIDYGTVHMYPWDTPWISQHGDQAKSIGKPVVLKEFGTTNTGSRYNTVKG